MKSVHPFKAGSCYDYFNTVVYNFVDLEEISLRNLKNRHIYLLTLLRKVTNYCAIKDLAFQIIFKNCFMRICDSYSELWTNAIIDVFISISCLQRVKSIYLPLNIFLVISIVSNSTLLLTPLIIKSIITWSWSILVSRKHYFNIFSQVVRIVISLVLYAQ